MNKKALLSLGFTALFSSVSMGQTIIAYWDQNSNDLPAGGFGFTTSSFPQDADLGNGTLTIGGVSFAVNAGDVYTSIQSFGGTTVNAQGGAPAGGSFSPQGGQDNENNGMYFDLNVDLGLWEGITVSWAQRGTSSGFTDRQFSYSVDGGVSFTDVGSDTGALGSAFTLQSYDLTSVTALNGASNTVFRVTLDGATGASGNNRFDNILVGGTQIPEPSATFLVLGAAGLAVLRRRRA
ncbi:MAG: PEP-CTERM sorting domain-containing protein [Puniceicoccaceae bacterium]